MRLDILALGLLAVTGSAAPIKRQTLPTTYDPAVAQIIYNVGVSLGISPSSPVMVAAFETAWVESHMNNLNFGDADSLGVFQQRPSQGWGTAAQVQNPTYAATAFFNQAIRIYNLHPTYTSDVLSQKVQHSAYPNRYGLAVQKAMSILSAVQNGDAEMDEGDNTDDSTVFIDDENNDGEQDDIDVDYPADDDFAYNPTAGVYYDTAGDDGAGGDVEDDTDGAGDGDDGGDGGDDGGDGGDDGGDGGDDGGGDDGGGDDGGDD